MPVIVAGEVDASARARVLDALLSALPGDVRRIELAGPTEDFAWLPEAGSIGWRSDGPTPGRPAIEPATADSAVILAGDLATDELGATWAGVVRIAVRAVSVGYGLAGTIAAPSLEAVLGQLRAAPRRLTEDELSRLGLVLIVEAQPDDWSGCCVLLLPTTCGRSRATCTATPEARSGRARDVGRAHGPLRALRLGRHAGACDAHRPSCRGLRDRTRAPARRARPRRLVTTQRPATLAELRASGWRSRTVKEELRANLIARLATGEPIPPGVVGYEDSVIPALENAILAGQDIVFLGERGQAKTRMARELVAASGPVASRAQWRRAQRRSLRPGQPRRPRGRSSSTATRRRSTGCPATGAMPRSWRPPTSRSPTSSARSTRSRSPRAATCRTT